MLYLRKFIITKKTLFISKALRIQECGTISKALRYSIQAALRFLPFPCNFPGSFYLLVVDHRKHMNLFNIPSVPEEERCFHRERSKYSSSGQTVSIYILLTYNLGDHLFHLFLVGDMK